MKVVEKTFAIMIFGLALLCAYGKPAESAADFSSNDGFAEVAHDDERVQGAESQIEKHLLSPATAKTASAEIRTNANTFWVKIDLDSQNTYGALVRSQWGVKMQLRSYQVTNVWWHVAYCDELAGPTNVCK